MGELGSWIDKPKPKSLFLRIVKSPLVSDAEMTNTKAYISGCLASGCYISFQHHNFYNVPVKVCGNWNVSYKLVL